VPQGLPPSPLSAILSENVRLERILATLEQRALAEPDPDDADADLASIVLESDGAGRAVPVAPDRRRRAILTLGFLIPVALFVVFSRVAREPRAGETPSLPREETVVHLSGVIVSRSGTIEADPGDRCDITIVDSGDLVSPPGCHIQIHCPRVDQGFNAARCPIAGPGSPVRMQSNGITIDELARTATFIVGWHGEVIRGGATLRLGAAP
jgi:hypothetical protein